MLALHACIGHLHSGNNASATVDIDKIVY